MMLTTKIGSDSTQFRADVASLPTWVEGSWTKMNAASKKGEKEQAGFFDGFAGKFANLKNVGTAAAAALGLNIQAIAENIARLYAGVSKETEQLFTSIAALSDKAAASGIEAMRQRLNDQQKYNLLVTDAARIEGQLNAVYGSSLAAQEKRLALTDELNRKMIEIGNADKAFAEERRKADEAAFKAAESRMDRESEALQKIHQAQIDALSTDKQVLAIKADIAAMEAVILSGAVTAETKERMGLEIAEKRAEIIKAESEIKKEALRTEEKYRALMKEQHEERTKYAKENAEMLDLEAKGYARRTKQENDRLEILKLQTTEKGIQASLEELLAIPVNQRTKAETQIIHALQDQRGIIHAQIAQKTTVLDQTKAQVVEETKVTNELLARHQVMKAFQQSVIGGASAEELNRASDATLTELVRRNTIKAQEMMIGRANIDTPNEYYRLKNEATRAQQEIDFRKQFRANAAVGEDYARRNYSGVLNFESVFGQIVGQGRIAADGQPTGAMPLKQETQEAIISTNNILKKVFRKAA